MQARMSPCGTSATLSDTARKAALSSEADTSVRAARTDTAWSSKSVMIPRFGGNLDPQDPVPRFVPVGAPSACCPVRRHRQQIVPKGDGPGAEGVVDWLRRSLRSQRSRSGASRISTPPLRDRNEQAGARVIRCVVSFDRHRRSAGTRREEACRHRSSPIRMPSRECKSLNGADRPPTMRWFHRNAPSRNRHYG